MERENSDRSENVPIVTTLFGEEEESVVSQRGRLLAKYRKSTANKEKSEFDKDKEWERENDKSVKGKTNAASDTVTSASTLLNLDEEVRCAYCGAENDQDGLISRSKEEEVGSLFIQMHDFFESKLKGTVSEEERDILCDAYLALEEMFLSSLLSRESLLLRLSHSNRSLGGRKRSLTHTHSAHSFSHTHSQSSERSLSSATEGVCDVSLYRTPSPAPSPSLSPSSSPFPSTSLSPSPSLSSLIESLFAELESLLTDVSENDVCLLLSSLPSLSSPLLSSLSHPRTHYTLLHIVCLRRKPKVAVTLIERGFSVHCVGADSRLPIHLLIENQISDESDRGVSRVDDVTWTPLYHALLQGVDPNYTIPLQSPRKNALLLHDTRAVLPNLDNHAGDTLLHFAASAGSVTLFSLLTSLGANVQAQNQEGVGVMERIVCGRVESASCDMLSPLLVQMERERMCDVGGVLLRLGTGGRERREEKEM